MTPAERLDAYAARGIDVYLGTDGRLRVRGPAWLRDAARPTILQHRSALIAYLSQTAGAVDRESSAGPQTIGAPRFSEALCPKCARP